MDEVERVVALGSSMEMDYDVVDVCLCLFVDYVRDRTLYVFLRFDGHNVSDNVLDMVVFCPKILMHVAIGEAMC